MKLNALSLVLVGAGKMGGAMLTGWLGMDLEAKNVTVIDPGQPEDMKALSQKTGFALVASPDGIAQPDILVIAIKPQMMAKVLPGLKALVGPQTVVVSIAAGTPIATFQSYLGAAAGVVRVMPNTPAQVGRGMFAAFASAEVTEDMRQTIAALMSSTGKFTWVGEEALIDAVTAISGSGPAYVFYMVEALAKAGEALGLEPDAANLMARQTIVGAGELLNQSELHAATLRENVTSPGGTTAAALAILMAEQGGLDELMAKATVAARDRSIELAK
ncbi:pyrroline-5-carboxylate reductase [uncultured Cohaesibacter sp.]|uniref:pyrroline-5-carboxylate reductase n=1 Tax=uncultured Cohaesibacter sp. TaxID=1002546 RepID=UPI0029C8A987|nr:pyrroline-5-carboxylate reductase [uncultured Cohaesibacter sp.]